MDAIVRLTNRGLKMQYFVGWRFDAGHEWLTVRVADCKKLELREADFSSHSYKGKQGFCYYLEGDSDAGFFIEAVEKAGAELVFIPSQNDGSQSLIRTLPRMKGESRLFNARMAERQAAKQAVLSANDTLAETIRNNLA